MKSMIKFPFSKLNIYFFVVIKRFEDGLGQRFIFRVK